MPRTGFVLIAVLLVGCASAYPRNQAARTPIPCTLDGFAPSPGEHLVNEVRVPFRVRSARGVVTNAAGGEWPDGAVVTLQFRPRDKRLPLRTTTTSGKGAFALPDLADGEYCFKASAVGWQSVIGVVFITPRAKASALVAIEMLLGV